MINKNIDNSEILMINYGILEKNNMSIKEILKKQNKVKLTNKLQRTVNDSDS